MLSSQKYFQTDCNDLRDIIYFSVCGIYTPDYEARSRACNQTSVFFIPLSLLQHTSMSLLYIGDRKSFEEIQMSIGKLN